MEKTLPRLIIAIIAIQVFSYFIGSLIGYSFDVTQWNEYVKDIIIVFDCLLSIGVSTGVFVFKKNI